MPVKTQPQAFTFLKANCGKHCLGALTSTDTQALMTSISLCPLISHRGAPEELFAAYGAIVRQMQPHTRWLAFHAIAMELDWSHRFMIWEAAGLPDADRPKHKAAWEHGGTARQ